MSITYNTEHKKNYFLVESHGKSDDLNEAGKFANEVSVLCKEQGYNNMLLDETDREYVLAEVLDLYKLANLLKTIDVSNLRVAIICQSIYLDHIRFLETMANNRGMNIKFFLDKDSAEHWLL